MRAPRWPDPAGRPDAGPVHPSAPASPPDPGPPAGRWGTRGAPRSPAAAPLPSRKPGPVSAAALGLDHPAAATAPASPWRCADSSRASGTRMQACTHARAHAQLNASLGQAGRRLTPASSSAANMEMTHFAHLTPGRICTSQQRTTGRGASRGRGRRGSGQATSPVTAARAWAWAPGPRGSRGACDQSTRCQDAGYF